MTSLLIALTTTLVFCAPGYPGAAEDAQPLVDGFAHAAAAAAHWPAGSLAAVYDPTEAGGLAKLDRADAALAFVPYPFFVQHAAALHLVPLAEADVSGVGTQQRWTLVLPRGAAQASLAGYRIVSTAGYAPQFVRGVALASLPLPAGVSIEDTDEVLTALRRAATGERVGVLLDQAEAAALPTLPFAGGLWRAAESSPLPVAFVTVVDGRLPKARADSFRTGLLELNRSREGAQALGQLELRGFVSVQHPLGAGSR